MTPTSGPEPRSSREQSAHALLPSTLLFAFLPHLAAWVLAEALTLAAGALGGFVLLRRNGCRTLAAGLGGATFGLGGFVSSQIVHIDFVSASASLVWCLVALDGIAHDEPRRRAAWALLLAAASACLGLSGSPDIVIDTVVAFAVYGGHLLINERGRPARLARLGRGRGHHGPTRERRPVDPDRRVPLGHRARPSQLRRSQLRAPSQPAELLVSIVPHLLGGGPIGLEAYTGPYNLAELDAYCGILSLVAVVALLTRWHSEGQSVGASGISWAASVCCWPSGPTPPPSACSSTSPSWASSGSRAGRSSSSRSPRRCSSGTGSKISSHQNADGRARGQWRPGSSLPLSCLAWSPPRPCPASLTPEHCTRSPVQVGRCGRLFPTSSSLAASHSLPSPWSSLVPPGRGGGSRRRSRALVIADLLVFTANQSSLAPVYSRTLDTSNSLQTKLRGEARPRRALPNRRPRPLGRDRAQPGRSAGRQCDVRSFLRPGLRLAHLGAVYRPRPGPIPGQPHPSQHCRQESSTPSTSGCCSRSPMSFPSPSAAQRASRPSRTRCRVFRPAHRGRRACPLIDRARGRRTGKPMVRA